ncbi:MAG: xanthine dehydrogenase family protein molybdopterin-binding subunit [Acidobacteria bacterium]|jgi:xanthine dehydrogenase YagR molybdenum-binding subunit|nr:xanthine dehydrogenase family protein molybdopterin-binding subunit [Acidobacteriota bacterium]
MPQEDKAEEPSVTFKARAGLPSDPKEMEVHAGEGDLKPWDLDDLPKFQQVGKPHTRIDGPLKVTGQAKYSYDVKLPGMLYGRMVGASIPAGVIVSIDTSKAEALPGVKAVWTAEAKKVRFAGQDVAAVAATSPEIAADAARLVEVQYEEKPFVHELRAAMEDGAPTVFAADEAPVGEDQTVRGNIAGPNKGGRGNVAAGFAQAAVTIEKTYYLPVHTHSPLETHGVVAHWEGDQLTVYASTQGVYAVREGLAEALEIDRKNVRVICQHMGGGFGSKLGPSATGSAVAMVACKLAKKAGAPVKLMLDRHQEQLCTGNAPSAQITVKIGAKKDGTLTAVEYTSYGSAGVAGGAGTAGPVRALYANNPNLKIEEYSVFTNAGPAAPLRAPGHSQGAFAVESAMDELAEKLGMDPLELRKKNESSPVRSAEYDPGAKAIGWERRNKKAGDTPGPKKRGIGMANGNWYVFANPNVKVQVKIHRDGSVELFSGAQDIGSGFRTMIAVVAAEELGIAPSDITSRVGDTQFPVGPASGGSITTNSVAPAVRLAANDAKKKLFEVAAKALDADPAELESEGGKVFVASDPSRSLTFKEAASRMPGEVIDCTAERKKQYETFRGDIAGTQFAEVEVDTETGEVRVLKMVSVNDCGFPVNTLTAKNQVIGAMIQGASWALLEDRIIDPMVGTMVNPDLEAYKILSPRDMFEAESILVPQANLGNNTSAAGIGEPPIVPTLGAIANAIYNATGARVRELPMTPDRVLAALAEAKGA